MSENPILQLVTFFIRVGMPHTYALRQCTCPYIHMSQIRKRFWICPCHPWSWKMPDSGYVRVNYDHKKCSCHLWPWTKFWICPCHQWSWKNIVSPMNMQRNSRHLWSWKVIGNVNKCIYPCHLWSWTNPGYVRVTYDHENDSGDVRVTHDRETILRGKRQSASQREL
jgi:hypothetical protein